MGVLEAVGRRGEDLAEAALQAQRALVLHVPEHARLGVDDGGEPHRVGVQLLGDDALGARLDEAGLVELGAQALLQQDRARHLQRRQARGEEGDARLEVDGEVPEAAEQVLVLPAQVEVRLDLGGVDLQAAAEAGALQLLRLHADEQRHGRARRRGLRERGHDLDSAEGAQFEHGALGPGEDRGRVGVAGREAERAAHGALGELAQALDAHLAEGGPGAGARVEDEERVAAGEIDVGAPLHRGPGVAAVGERAPHRGLGLAVGLLLEDAPALHERGQSLAHGSGVLRGQVVEAVDARLADEHGPAFVDHHRDVDVLFAPGLHAPRQDPRVVVATRAVEALHAREVALHDAAVPESRSRGPPRGRARGTGGSPWWPSSPRCRRRRPPGCPRRGRGRRPRRRAGWRRTPGPRRAPAPSRRGAGAGAARCPEPEQAPFRARGGSQQS